MHCWEVLLLLISMSRLVKGESGSCLQLFKKQRMLHGNMCQPCLLLSSKDRMYFKAHNIAIVGVCHILHPPHQHDGAAATLPPPAEEGDQENNIMNNEARGRTIHRPPVFVAEPSNKVEHKYKRSCKIVLAGGCIEEFDSLSHRHFWKGVGGVVSVSNVGFWGPRASHFAQKISVSNLERPLAVVVLGILLQRTPLLL
jgi:hypothetical protein